MSDIKLFRTNGDSVEQLEGQSVALEKSLQELIEKHLEKFLGIRFLASEYATSKTHAGRMDTLGIDENGCPCIIEYKRARNENVINQGLYYLDWLMDHQGAFELLVQKRLGADVAETIEWSSPRLLCIAGDFTKYDSHAVQQINRNIELLRYLRFGEEFLLLELVNAVQATSSIEEETIGQSSPQSKTKGKSFNEQLDNATPQLRNLYEAIKATCLSFGDDVQFKALKKYGVFKRLKNFVSIDVRATLDHLYLYVRVDPDSIELEEGFTRNVRKIGHYGTGDLEITLRTLKDIEKALPLLQSSYESS